MGKKYEQPFTSLLELKQIGDLLKKPDLTLLQKASLKIRYEYLADELREKSRIQH